jgi:hypothetical protein
MDHYPFDSGSDPALLQSIHDVLSLISTQPPVVAPVSTPRFVLRYGVYVCQVCKLAKDYCKGHAPAAALAQDGAESSLGRRIAEWKDGR